MADLMVGFDGAVRRGVRGFGWGLILGWMLLGLAACGKSEVARPVGAEETAAARLTRRSSAISSRHRSETSMVCGRAGSLRASERP